MKTLLLLRHAKSSWKKPTLADHARPLNKRGQHDAPLVGAWLPLQHLVPDLVLSSTAVRARDTAQAVIDASGYRGEWRGLPQLYHATPADLVAVLQTLPQATQQVLVVGHNPGLEELVTLLTGETITLPTAALAQLVLPLSSWAKLKLARSAQLVWVRRPADEMRN